MVGRRGRTRRPRPPLIGVRDRFGCRRSRPRSPLASAGLAGLAGVALLAGVATTTVTGASPRQGGGRGAAVRSAVRARREAAPAPTGTPQAPGIVVASAPFDLPDAFVLDVDRTYDLFMSSAFADPRQDNVPVLAGVPGHWRRLPDALPVVPPWALSHQAHGTTWSPTVHRFGARFVLYFSSTVRGSSPPQHCIGLATSPVPTGPFRPAGRPFICQRSLGGDIDAQVFVDPSAPAGGHATYLVWKSDNNSTAGAGTTTIYSEPLSGDGMHLLGRPTPIYAPHLAWQIGLIEAPQMLASPDHRIWLFYSAGGGSARPTYGMGVARCATPTGPCSDPSAGPLVSSNAQGSGPGEETVYTANDDSTWLIYSPWHANMPFAWRRPAEAVRIGWGAGGPYVARAGTFPPPT